MINHICFTDKDVRRLARKPLGTNGKSLKITSQEFVKIQTKKSNLLEIVRQRDATHKFHC